MNLIPRDYSRCSNFSCEKRNNCKRFLQLNYDFKSKDYENIIVSDFKKEDCEYFIENLKS
jgi:hypothetical protein